MMKRLVILLITLLSCSSLFAQDELLTRILELSLPETLEARFVQTRRSPLYTKDLVSKGKVSLARPDKIRWETEEPSHKVLILSSAAAKGRRRFTLPSASDFTVTVLEGEDYTLTLIPLRRDLSALFQRIILHARKDNYMIQSIVLDSGEGDYTHISFSDIRTGMPLPDELFQE